MTSGRNVNDKVVQDFGKEWRRFDQSALSGEELEKLFERYFDIFPFHELPDGAKGFDLGCGSGRWASLVAPRVGMLHCIDPSQEALNVAKSNLEQFSNCRFHLAGVDDIPLEDGSMDFGYSIGVLHHVPDTLDGIRQCIRKLKPGAFFLIYLYYAFDNRPDWFRRIWRLSNAARKIIATFPFRLKLLVTQAIAALVYFPLAKLSALLERLKCNVEAIPLAAYRDKSFYTMKTDALDRFGTRIEKRFTKCEINEMLCECGLTNIRFSNHSPYWVAVGARAR